MNRKNLRPAIQDGASVSPSLVAISDWVLVERARRCVKVIDAHDQEQILISPEDGIFGNTDFFQFG